MRVLILLSLATCGRADPGDHPGVVSAELSTVTVGPSDRIFADGIATFSVVVIVRDTRGESLAGARVALLVEGDASVRQPEPTDVAGVTVGQVATTIPGDRTLAVVVNPGQDQVTLASTPTLGFGRLMLAYSFDEDTVLVEDLSPGGYDGSVVGVTWTADGRHGGAFEFDGTDDEVDIGYAMSGYFAEQVPHEAVTVEAWVRPREISRPQTIYQLGGDSNSVALGIDDTGHAWFVTRSDQSGPVDIRSPEPLAVDTWVHLAGALSLTDVTLYVGGDAVASLPEHHTWFTGLDGHTIGRHPRDCSGLFGACSRDGLFFAGTIDDLRVWEYGRSAADVLDDMGRPAP